VTGASELAQALGALEPLLARQREALRSGDADALTAASLLMRHPLAVLARHARVPGALPPEWRARLQALARESEAARAMLVRRAVDVERSLAALGTSTRLRDRGLQGTYAAQGGLAATSLRQGGCAVA
jgi:hypothetical protein